MDECVMRCVECGEPKACLFVDNPLDAEYRPEAARPDWRCRDCCEAAGLER